MSGTNKNIKSESILDVGVHKALRDIHWDEESFRERGGVYEWTKEELGAEAGGCSAGVGREFDDW